jgi:hypothetical protein
LSFKSTPKIKLAAVQLGELFKYTTTLNQIKRIATSVFTFSYQRFPVDGITSERSKLIYDWLMTLFAQKIADEDKLEQLKTFLENLSSPEELQKVNQILIDANIIKDNESNHAPIKIVNDISDTELLKLIFRPELFERLPLEAALCEVLVARMKEASNCINCKAYLASVILCGSVLEGLCLGFGSYNPQIVNRGYSNLYNKKAKQLHEWKLKEWIEVLGHINVLSPNITKFGHALRDFRNYVHPREEIAYSFKPDHHTARIGFQVVLASVEDLLKASGQPVS